LTHSISIKVVKILKLTHSISVKVVEILKMIHSISVKVVEILKLTHSISVKVVEILKMIHSISVKVVDIFCTLLFFGNQGCVHCRMHPPFFLVTPPPHFFEIHHVAKFMKFKNKF
jgi:hypothetical protein